MSAGHGRAPDRDAPIITLRHTLAHPIDPSAVFASLAPADDAVLLDSVIGDADRGRMTLLALELSPAATVQDDHLRLVDERGQATVLKAEPRLFGWLDRSFERDRQRRAAQPHALGWIGFLAWEAARLCDPAMPRRPVDLPFPLLRFDRVRAALRFPAGPSPAAAPPELVVEGTSPDEARQRLDRWLHHLQRIPAPSDATDQAAALPRTPPAPGPSLPDGDAYRRGVAQIRAAIRDGQVYQVCLTTPIDLPAPPTAGRHALAEDLRARSPGDFAFRLRMGALEALSTSPEQFLRVRGRRVTTRPMKGTRAIPPGATDEAIAQLAHDLAESPKDRAENLMIVDLLRNDLHRVCVPGSVQVPRLFEVERYRSVLQMTSTVEGLLEEHTGPFRLLQAVFPPGSMSGAPKIEACHVIDTLEARPRGLYAGTVGWLGHDLHHTFGVVIRTLQCWDEQARWDVGGGIVHESDPDDEWREALAKAAPLLGPTP